MGGFDVHVITRRRLLLGSGLALTSLVFTKAQRPARLITHVTAPMHVGLHWRRADGRTYETLADLRAGLDQPFAALMNAGIFEVGPDGEFQPQGLHIEQGREYRPLNIRSAPNANFYLKPNGVFYIDDAGAHVVRTEAYAPTMTVRLATQSGPLLFDAQGIHPRFLEGSSSRKRRNAIGVRADGQVVFALAERPINFWDLVTALREEEGCTAALYLDGTISSLWRASDGAAPNARQPFAAMLSATA